VVDDKLAYLNYHVLTTIQPPYLNMLLHHCTHNCTQSVRLFKSTLGGSQSNLAKDPQVIWLLQVLRKAVKARAIVPSGRNTKRYYHIPTGLIFPFCRLAFCVERTWPSCAGTGYVWPEL